VDDAYLFTSLVVHLLGHDRYAAAVPCLALVLNGA